MTYALILAHLIGDYVLQSHVMATRKTSSWRWALIHAAFYSLPFAGLLLWLGVGASDALGALTIIGGTHALIDRLRIATRWCEWYGVGHPGIWVRAPRAMLAVWARWLTRRGYRHGWDDVTRVFPFEAPPPFLGVWLTIIVTNTLHLTINGLTFWAILQ